MPVIIGALREGAPNETRVSLVPEVADKFAASGAHVCLERGAGTRARFPDANFKNVEWLDSSDAVLAKADVVLTVQPLTVAQIGQLKAGAVVIGFMQPHARHAEIAALRERRRDGGPDTAFGRFEAAPRKASQAHSDAEGCAVRRRRP